MLTQSEIHELFVYDDGRLVWRTSLRRGMAGKRAGTMNQGGYRQVRVHGKIYLEHRLIYAMHHGHVPKVLDHVNGDRADNRICNLRACTAQQNGYNRIGWGKKDTPKGVTWSNKTRRWQAQLSIAGKNTYLGQFRTIEEAAAKVASARKLHHDKFSKD